MSTPRTHLDRYIGDKVKWLRRDRQILQEVLALKIDMGLTDYKAAEVGKARFTSSQLVRLGVIFGVDVAYFFPEVALAKEVRIDPGTAQPSTHELYHLMHYFSGVAEPSLRAALIESVRRVSDFD